MNRTQLMVSAHDVDPIEILTILIIYKLEISGASEPASDFEKCLLLPRRRAVAPPHLDTIFIFGEDKVSIMSFLEENPTELNERSIKRSRKKKDKRVLEESLKDEDNKDAIDGKSLHEGANLTVSDGRKDSDKKRKRKKHFDDNATQDFSSDGVQKEVKEDSNDNNAVKSEENEENKKLNDARFDSDLNVKVDAKMLAKKEKRKKRLMEQAAKAKNRGICYMSRIPHHMDHVKLRQLLSQYGEIDRIYLAPEDPAAQIKRKSGGGFRGQQFAEGWVEFANKNVAKRVANMLNGEPIGGRKRSPWFYDLWNIKYLSKFKWDDLTEEFAYKSAVREQRLALELAAAKRERNLYESLVEKSKGLDAIEERLKKKQKVELESGATSVQPITVKQKVIRRFEQKQPYNHEQAEKKQPMLSRELLAGVFGA